MNNPISQWRKKKKQKLMASRDLKGGGWESHVVFFGGGELGGRGRLHRGGAARVAVLGMRRATRLGG